MKRFIHIRRTLYYGECCRVFILFNHIYLAFSRERKRFLLEVVI